jgi:phasin
MHNKLFHKREHCANRRAERAGLSSRREGDKERDSVTNASYQVPTEIRDFAEKSVEQARKAFEGFSGAAQKAISSLDTSALPFTDGAKDVGVTAMSYAEANVKAAFDLAQKLVKAKDVHEVMELQSEFMKAQFDAFQEQAKALGTAFQKAATQK